MGTVSRLREMLQDLTVAMAANCMAILVIPARST